MREPPPKFSRGPKPTREKLNALIDAVRSNVLIPGEGLRIRESKNGVLLSLDERILLAAGMANSGNYGRKDGDGKNPHGAGPGITGADPDTTNPDDESWDGSGGTGGTGGGTGGTGGTGGADSARGQLRILTLSLPDAEIGTGYDQTLVAAGGTGGPYTWTVSSGSIPAGMTFISFGEIYGTPTTLGTSTFTVQVSDGVSTASVPLSIAVLATGALRIIVPSTLSGNWLKPWGMTQTVLAVGGTPPYNLRIVGGYWNWPLQFVANAGGASGTLYQAQQYFVGNDFNFGGVTVRWDREMATDSKLALLGPTIEIPYRIDLGVTDAVGNGATASTTIVLSFDLGTHGIYAPYTVAQVAANPSLLNVQGKYGRQWMPRSQGQAQGLAPFN